jgi:hypothetical protein
MSGLHLERCRNHPDREAAVRCPACGRYCCRECVVEHERRLLCADCLAALTRPAAGRRRVWWWAWVPVQWGVGVLVAWLSFHGLGRVLSELPDEFHDGSFWERVAGVAGEDAP